MFQVTQINSLLEFDYLEGEGGSDLVLRLWVGQSLAWSWSYTTKIKFSKQKYYSNPQTYQAERFRTKSCCCVYVAVPPLWSEFPDFGQNPNFLGQIGPDWVKILLKSSDFV